MKQILAQIEELVRKYYDKLSERSEEHTSELQSHSFISYAVFCLKKKKKQHKTKTNKKKQKNKTPHP